jgi:hypothetical protein
MPVGAGGSMNPVAGGQSWRCPSADDRETEILTEGAEAPATAAVILTAPSPGDIRSVEGDWRPLLVFASNVKHGITGKRRHEWLFGGATFDCSRGMELARSRMIPMHFQH